MRPLTGLFAACAVALGTSAAPAQGLLRDSEIEHTLDRMAAPIFRAAGISPSTVEIYLVSSRELNAFVAGGRNIFIFSGLVQKLETREELIGVIAHETGHIAGGHLARRAIQSREAVGPAAIGLLIAIAAGAAGAPEAVPAILGGSSALSQRSLLAHSRSEESAADQAAVDYLLRAGVDPQGMLQVLELFRGQEVFTAGNIDPYVRTHPISTTRYELMARRIEEQTAGRAFADDPEMDYWYARMRAKFEGFLDRPERVITRYEGQPETEPALYATSVAYHRLGDWARATALVDRLIAIRPDDPWYWELKGQILFESGRGPDAVAPYRRAVALAPGDPLIAGGLGRALLALGEPGADAEALRVLEQARRDDIADAAVLRDLAVAYSRAGDDGMATLVTAERYALANDIRSAVLHAERALRVLATGSPGARRAEDILALKVEDE